MDKFLVKRVPFQAPLTQPAADVAPLKLNVLPSTAISHKDTPPVSDGVENIPPRTDAADAAISKIAPQRKGIEFSRSKWLAAAFRPYAVGRHASSFLRNDAVHHAIRCIGNIKPVPIDFLASEKHPVQGLHAAVSCMEFDSCGGLLFTSTSSGVVRLYDFDDFRAESTFITNASVRNSSVVLDHIPKIAPIHSFQTNFGVECARWVPQADASVAIASGSTAAVAIYDLTKLPKKPSQTLQKAGLATQKHEVGNSVLYFQRDAAGSCAGNQLLVGDAGGFVRLWDLRSAGAAKWALDVGAAAKHMVFSTVANSTDAVSGVKRSRTDTAASSATGKVGFAYAPGEKAISEIISGWTTEQQKVRSLFQGSDSHLLHAVIAGGLFVTIDLRKMQRAAFAGQATPTVVSAAFIADPTKSAGQLIQSVCVNDRVDSTIHAVLSNGHVRSIDPHSGATIFSYRPTDVMLAEHPSASMSVSVGANAAQAVSVGGTTIILVPQQRIIAVPPPMPDDSHHRYFRGGTGAFQADAEILFEGGLMDLVCPEMALSEVKRIVYGEKCSWVRSVPGRVDEFLVGGSDGDLSVFRGETSS